MEFRTRIERRKMKIIITVDGDYDDFIDYWKEIHINKKLIQSIEVLP
jgi:hypothetical protein